MSSLFASSSSGSGACVGLGSLDGDWLFSFSAKLSPKKAIALQLTIASALDAQGNLTLAMKETPLSAADQKTPAGSQVDLGVFDVGSDGSFTFMLPQLTVPGAADPVVVGQDLVAQITLTGDACADPDFICGAASGNVTQPIQASLSGSTFTFQRIGNGAIPSPIINCAGDPAEY